MRPPMSRQGSWAGSWSVSGPRRLAQTYGAAVRRARRSGTSSGAARGARRPGRASGRDPRPAARRRAAAWRRSASCSPPTRSAAASARRRARRFSGASRRAGCCSRARSRTCCCSAARWRSLPRRTRPVGLIAAGFAAAALHRAAGRLGDPRLLGARSTARSLAQTAFSLEVASSAAIYVAAPLLAGVALAIVSPESVLRAARPRQRRRRRALLRARCRAT